MRSGINFPHTVGPTLDWTFVYLLLMRTFSAHVHTKRIESLIHIFITVTRRYKLFEQKERVLAICLFVYERHLMHDDYVILCTNVDKVTWNEITKWT